MKVLFSVTYLWYPNGRRKRERERQCYHPLSPYSRLIAFKFPSNSPWNHPTIFIYFFVCDFMVSYISFQHKPSSGIIFLYQIHLHIIPTFSFIFMEVTLPCSIMCLQEGHFILCSCLGFLLFFFFSTSKYFKNWLSSARTFIQ